MFDSVPDWLTEKVKALRGTVDAIDREMIYYAAAGWTIAWYLRKDIQDPSTDPFFDPPSEKPVYGPDPAWNAHVNRATLIAETLFLLRRSPGFDEQRKRLAERPMRSAFFEMLSAKQFFKQGFEICARPEILRRGEDYDFAAVGSGVRINVEVTALTAPNFSEKTIANRLNDKRGQLPNDAPAVIYCAIPEPWTIASDVDWDKTLGRVAGNFLRGTKRINAIVFWCDQHIDRVGGGSALTVLRKPYKNQAPRHPADLEFLFDGQSSEHVRHALATGKGLDALEKESYDSEFFRWVDSLVPAE